MTLLIRDGKARKDRIVPLPVRAALALDLYLSEARGELVKRHGETAVFLSKYGRPVSKSLVEVVVQRYAKAAGIGRLLAEDPILTESWPNLYAYVGNEPVSCTDPSGEAQHGRRNITVTH